VGEDRTAKDTVDRHLRFQREIVCRAVIAAGLGIVGDGAAGGAVPGDEVARIARDRGKPILFASGYSAPILPAEFSGALLLQKPFLAESLQAALLAAAR